MQAIALRPKKSQITSRMIGLAALALLALAQPALCLPCALAAPLFACPLEGLRQRWAAYASAVVPAATSFAFGYDAAYSASLAAPGLATLAVAACQRARKTAVQKTAFAPYVAAYAAAMALVLWCAARAVGGDLPRGLGSLVAGELGDASAATLQRLVATGLAGVPREFRNAGALSYAFDPILRGQLLLSLGLTVRLAVSALAPRLFVEIAMVGGLFTCLRVMKLNHSFLLVKAREGAPSAPEDVSLARPVGFTMLELQPWLRGPAVLAALGALLLPAMGEPLAQTLGALCSAAFQCGFKLIGAAVLTALLAARWPERGTLCGALAAAVYVLLPTLALLVGLADQLLHFRSKTLKHQEEE